jgi:murein DD-endopeptidase MepM/ murein hydrolase activator NlpD
MQPRSFATVIAVVCIMTGPLTADTARAGDGATGDALSLARIRLDAARVEAEQLSERLSHAQLRRRDLELAIDEGKRAIPALRARADELRGAVKDRAIELYVRHANRLETVFATESVVSGARAAQFAGNIARHDAARAAELRDTASQVELREVQLERERDALQEVVALLVPLQEQLREGVEEASAAYERVRSSVDALARDGARVDIRTGATRCPVAGFVVFTDDFSQSRPGGATHQAIDMSAVAGTPVVAVVDGIMRHDVGGAGGNGAWLRGNDGVAYYYAHFSRYEGLDRLVGAGDVIGYIGSTGNATGPHLHFEMHPGASAATNPYPFLLALCSKETGDDVG